METKKIKWIEEYLEQALKIASMEDYEQAIAMLERLLYEEPGYGRLHNTLGILYKDYADESRKAEQHLKHAIRFSPDFAEPYRHLAELLKADERHEEVIAICEKGIGVKKSDKSLLLETMGNAWELKRKYRRAIKAYRAALSHSAELYNCRALELSIKRCKRKQRKV